MRVAVAGAHHRQALALPTVLAQAAAPHVCPHDLPGTSAQLSHRATGSPDACFLKLLPLSRHGQATYENGSHYKGNFLRGSRQGWGLITFSSGDTYEGEWHHDCMLCAPMGLQREKEREREREREGERERASYPPSDCTTYWSLNHELPAACLA